MMLVRNAQASDWPEIWALMEPIVRAGDTFAYDTTMDEQDARDGWLSEPPGRTTIAILPDGSTAGTANMYPNHEGPGAHIASASFMVAAEHSGKGVGRTLVEDALTWARNGGFRGMQFNAVAESNTRAVGLYESLGFHIVGTVPEAFRHPSEGYVGLHIMYRRL